MAGDLEIGERILSKSGEVCLDLREEIGGVREVYNLEVKDWHNFLVGDLGVVVHNSCLTDYMNFFFGKFTRRKVPGKKWVDYAEESGLGIDVISKKEINQLERLGKHENKRMLHLNKDKNGSDFEAIDGFFKEGNKAIPISLKEMADNTTSINTLNSRLSELSKIKAANDKEKFTGMLKNVHAMITGRGFTKAQIAAAIKGKRKVSEGQRFIKKYFIEASDGSGWFDGTNWL